MINTNVNKYLDHGISNPLVKFYADMKSTNVLTLPICPKCERVGLRDKGWALYKTMKCPHCGYTGHATHQLSAYLDEGLYK
jgi:predicted RNA-binding Zn-ribbon protein involved in translation (DUF1610 family)